MLFKTLHSFNKATFILFLRLPSFFKDTIKKKDK